LLSALAVLGLLAFLTCGLLRPQVGRRDLVEQLPRLEGSDSGLLLLLRLDAATLRSADPLVGKKGDVLPSDFGEVALMAEISPGGFSPPRWVLGAMRPASPRARAASSLLERGSFLVGDLSASARVFGEVGGRRVYLVEIDELRALSPGGIYACFAYGDLLFASSPKLLSDLVESFEGRRPSLGFKRDGAFFVLKGASWEEPSKLDGTMGLEGDELSLSLRGEWVEERTKGFPPARPAVEVLFGKEASLVLWFSEAPPQVRELARSFLDVRGEELDGQAFVLLGGSFSALGLRWPALRFLAEMSRPRAIGPRARSGLEGAIASALLGSKRLPGFDELFTSSFPMELFFGRRGSFAVFGLGKPSADPFPLPPGLEFPRSARFLLWAHLDELGSDLRGISPLADLLGVGSELEAPREAVSQLSLLFDALWAVGEEDGSLRLRLRLR